MICKLCPQHRTALIGGPIEYLCEAGHHVVHAADLSHEVDIIGHQVKAA
jgi:hypothetical protein